MVGKQYGITSPKHGSLLFPHPNMLVLGKPLICGRTFLHKLHARWLHDLTRMTYDVFRLILSKKERKLQKGSGFHLDLLLICYMEVGCAFVGAPWMCAATVRSVSHLASLTVMSRTHAPGESPHIIGVKEQRVTNFLVSLLVGRSPPGFFTPLPETRPEMFLLPSQFRTRVARESMQWLVYCLLL